MSNSSNPAPFTIGTTTPPQPDRRLSVAPMMEWTDRHERYFLRLISRHTLLYTEMVTTGAILHGDKHHLLDYNEEEHPLALQLGGSDPAALAQCARIAEQRGYDEVNLNVGCPSDRVQNGSFGACLMADPALVADCIKTMQDAVSIPVTVKHRIGIESPQLGKRDSYEELCSFIDQVAATGCQTFIVHARIAVLQGLSPKENRDIPPLKYDTVYQLKQDFPQLEMLINGGITTITDSLEHLQQVDGVMIGREAYQNPFILSTADQAIYGDNSQPSPTRRELLERFIPYIERELSQGTHIKHITRHILGLYKGERGGRQFRRHLSENAHKPEAGIEVLLGAMGYVE